MSKNKTQPLIPFQVKAPHQVRDRIVAEAEKRNLSVNDIASLAVAAGLDRVIETLDELTQPKKAA
jgi:hypothetical protein